MKRHLSVGEGYAQKNLNFKPLPDPTCSMKNTSLNQKIGWLVTPISWAKVTGLTGLVTLICFCLSVGSAAAKDYHSIIEIHKSTQWDPLLTINRKNVDLDTINSISSILRQKQDAPRVDYQKEHPFLINGNGGDGEELLYHSVLSRYKPGLQAWNLFGHNKNEGKWDSISGYRVTLLNAGLLRLFQAANYFEGQTGLFNSHTTSLEVSDPVPLTFPKERSEVEDWLQKFGFCYEVIVPYSAGVESLYQIFRSDLRKFFPQYDFHVERRYIDCLVLERTSNVDKLQTINNRFEVHHDFHQLRITNNYLDRIILLLGSYYMQDVGYHIVDGTGYLDRVDIEINARLNDVEAVNRELAKYDLQFVVRPFETEVLVIKDSGVPSHDFMHQSVNKDDIVHDDSNLTGLELKVGDKVPNITIENVHNYPKQVVNIGEFSGKLLILDFWATWCTPCVSFQPQLAELQNRYKEDIQILSVTYQSKDEVLPFLNRAFSDSPPNLVHVTGEQNLHHLFPHRVLPHFVWIDPAGEVLAFTGMDELSSENIEKVLKLIR